MSEIKKPKRHSPLSRDQSKHVSSAIHERALEAATKLFGPVNGLVNNAGRNVYADPATMTEQEWEDVFAVDLKSAWLAARAVLPAMKAANKGAIGFCNREPKNGQRVRVAYRLQD